MPKETAAAAAIETERLIECVKRHTLLYDSNHKDYKNVVLKNMIWDSIAQELGQNTDGDTVRTKWKNIRDGYTKHKKQLATGQLSNRKNNQYVWGPHLTFLDYYVQQASHSKNVSSPLNGQDSDSSESTPGAKRAKLKAKRKIYDGIDHLFLSYAHTFKKLPSRKQVLLKLELAKLFAEAELSQYEEGVVMEQLHGHHGYINVKLEDHDGHGQLHVQ